MPGNVTESLLIAVLAGGLLFAAFTDLRRRHIANWLNGALAALAPAYWWAAGLPLWSATDPWHSVAAQIALALITFAVGAGLFALRAMGGGDVKLLTALALWIAPSAFLHLIVVMALAGGVLTIVFAAWHTMRRHKDRLAIPYGLAIAFAGLWIIGVEYLPQGSAPAAAPAQPAQGTVSAAHRAGAAQ